MPHADVAWVYNMYGNGPKLPHGSLFEINPAKRRANEERHGVDFHHAQAIWLISVGRARPEEVALYEVQ